MTNFEGGQEVVFSDEYKTDSYYHPTTVAAGAVGTIRKVSTNKILVRVEANTKYLYGSGPGEITEQSVWVMPEYIEPVDPNAPKPRKLGEPPEGGIAVDDPRIAWLWEDAAKIATKKNFCAEYDKIADALGVPGRERTFTVKTTVDDLTLSVKVKARSRKLAEELVASKLVNVTEFATEEA